MWFRPWALTPGSPGLWHWAHRGLVNRPQSSKGGTCDMAAAARHSGSLCCQHPQGISLPVSLLKPLLSCSRRCAWQTGATFMASNQWQRWTALSSRAPGWGWGSFLPDLPLLPWALLPSSLPWDAAVYSFELWSWPYLWVNFNKNLRSFHHGAG